MKGTKVLESILKIISALIATAMSVVKLFDTINKAKKKA